MPNSNLINALIAQGVIGQDGQVPEDLLEPVNIKKPSIKPMEQVPLPQPAPVSGSGVRPEFRAELDRVARANPQAMAGPAIAQPSAYRGLTEEENQRVAEYQSEKDKIRRLRSGQATPQPVVSRQPQNQEIPTGRGYGGGASGYAYGFGNAWNPSGMSQQAQAALQRQGLMPPTTAPTQKPQSVLSQAIANLAPFGTTAEKMARGIESYQPHPDGGMVGGMRTRAFPQEDGGVTLVGGQTAGEPSFDLADARKVLPVNRRMADADLLQERISRRKRMNEELASRKKTAGGDLDELLEAGAKPESAVAAGIASINEAKKLKKAALNNPNANLTQKEREIAFESGRDAWEANEAAQREAHIRKEVEKARAANELLSQIVGGAIGSPDGGFRSQREIQQNLSQIPALMQTFNAMTGQSGAPVDLPPIFAGDTVDGPPNPVDAASRVAQPDKETVGVLTLLGVGGGSTADEIGRAIQQRQESDSPLAPEDLETLQDWLKDRQALDPTFSQLVPGFAVAQSNQPAVVVDEMLDGDATTAIERAKARRKREDLQRKSRGHANREKYEETDPNKSPAMKYLPSQKGNTPTWKNYFDLGSGPQ